MTDALDELLRREPFAILDGGLATQLERRGSSLADPLWSAKVLVEAPDELRAVHRAFAEAGADIVASASYQATIPGLVARGLDEAQARATLRRSVDLVREAVGPDKLVAASVGSYGAYLADGSEYRGDYGLDRAALIQFHAPRLLELSAAGPDLLAFETIPSATELEAIAEQLAASEGPRAWVSLSLRRDRELALSDGASLREAVAPLRGHPRVAAIGVNCIGPSEVQGAVEALAQLVPGVALIAYPNSGERWVDRAWAGAHVELEVFVQLARGWIDAGVRLVGGCCRTGPAHVAALAELRRERL